MDFQNGQPTKGGLLSGFSLKVVLSSLAPSWVHSLKQQA
jgi:hypothetical protein